MLDGFSSCDHLHLTDDLLHSTKLRSMVLYEEVIQLLQIENCLILHLVMIACLTRFRNLQKKTVKSKVWLLPTFSRWKYILITSHKTKCTIWNKTYQLVLVGRDCSKDSLWKYIRPILFTFNVGDWSIRPIRAHD